MNLNQPKRAPDEVLAMCAGISAAGLEAFYLDIRDSFALALTHAKVGAEQRREIVQVVDDYFVNHYGDYDGEAELISDTEAREPCGQRRIQWVADNGA